MVSTSLARLTGGPQGESPEFGGVDEEIGCRLIRREARTLRHVPDPRPDLEGLFGDRVTEDPDLPRSGGQDAQQELEEGGLACSVGAHQSDPSGREPPGRPR